MRLFISIILIILFSGCSCDDSDFAFSKAYRNIWNSYKQDDVLYFESRNKDLDTIYIAAIDSFQTCGSLLGPKVKVISVEVQHLPINKWTGGTYSENGVLQNYNQDLISVEKYMSGDQNDLYSVYISYRDFAGILNLNKHTSDSLLLDLGVAKYWEILNEWPRNEGMKSIKRVIWTEEYGLTAYYLKNGEYYKIKNEPNIRTQN